MMKPETMLMSAIFHYRMGGYFEDEELLEAVDGLTLRAMLLTVLTELENPPDTHYYRYQKPDLIFRSRVKRVMMLRFGLEGGQPLTLQKIGEVYGRRGETIRHIEAKAIRLLRHPTRSRRLEPYIKVPKGERRSGY